MTKSRKVSIKRKVVIVGDWNVGKTQILNVMAGRGFSSDLYQLRFVENRFMDLEMDGFQLELSLWDTTSNPDYDRLRPLSYPNSAILIICFAINNHDSFRSVSERWHPEILHFTAKAKVPLLIIGSKSDLRVDNGAKEGENSNPGRVEVSREQGSRLADQIGAAAYLECSAKTGKGIEELNRLIGEVAASWDPEEGERGRCLIA